MIIRIVRMTFKQEKTDNFLKIFNESKHKIRGFEGCMRLELLQDVHKQNVFTTYSYWKAESNLNDYRGSELFKSVWITTKALFSDKPIAHSYNQLIKLD